MTDRRYRQCMAEIMAVLKKYDMGGAITVVDKERAMFKYYFPSWTCITLGEDRISIRSKRDDYPSLEAQKETAELSAHCLMQMLDVAKNTYGLMSKIAIVLKEKWGMEHTSAVDFDPEREPTK